MVVHIEADNVKGKIVDQLSITQLSVLEEVCSFKVEGADFKANAFRHRAHGSFNWDGRKRLFHPQSRSFPIGLLTLVSNTFRNAGIQVEVIDKRIRNDEVYQYCIDGFGWRDYQTKAVMSSILYGNGIIKAATGSGKTTIAARTIAALQRKSIFIVHTRDLLYQTKSAFEKMFGQNIGQIGDGILDYQTITVATLQTLAVLGKIEYEYNKYDEDGIMDDEKPIDKSPEIIREFTKYKNSVDVVMMDEVQMVCNRTAFSVRFLFERANYAFGYSASPWRDDGCDLMIEAAFGPRIVDITASELIQKGFLIRPIIDITKFNSSGWSGSTYEQVYKTAIVENPLRNMQVVNDAHDELECGNNVLVLVTQIKHGEMLESMMHAMGMSAVFISGKSRMKKRKQVIEDMRNGNAPIVIASTIADVGLDVPRLNTIIEAGAGKSSVTALQRLGRIMRPFPGKTSCHFMTYDDSAPYLCKQIDKKVAIWQTEPEFVIRRS